MDDISVYRKGNLLILENSMIRRTLDLSKGAPRTISLQTSGGTELAAAENPVCDIGFIGLNEPGTAETPWQVKFIRCRKKRRDLFDAQRLIVEISMEEPLSRSCYTKNYILYPHIGAIGMECYLQPKVMPNFFWSHRNRIQPPGFLESTGDALQLAPSVIPRKSVEFRGRSDTEPVPVLEHPFRANEITGNLLYCGSDAGAGLVFLQEAPPSMERRDWEKYDFRYDPETKVIRSCNWGISPEDIQNGNRTYRSFRHVLMVYRDETEKRSVLKNYLARRYDSSAFYSITVNPWGCGRFPELVSPDFLEKECKAAAEAGATHYQFDDGWEKGNGLAQLTRKNQYITPDFWKFRESLDSAFPAIIQVCKKALLQPALWFAPSENVEYRDWRSSAERLWKLHRKFGINCFKIDGVRLRTLEAERNLRSLFEFLRKKSKGKIFFNLDVTTGQRFGYFQFLEFGNIFLENRYLFTNGNNSYHPEKTLRALWLLAKYTRPQSLQIEVPYPKDYLAQAPANDPPAEPDSCKYPLEYWIAITLFANPLLWFAPSLVPRNIRKVYRKMMELHLKIRDRVFAGEIYPIGEEPSGKSISGLISTSGFAIFFRAINAERKNACFEELEKGQWKLIAGDGSLSGGELTMTRKASFALFERIPEGKILP
ncbi:MAG: hypothetical protein IJH79_10705 [Lentisphaeria bacterium]|nr:hypothetical protein [Lentisphaeria bacterium]